jgi:hypothetical protein
VYWNHESAVVGNKDLRAYARRGGEVVSGLGQQDIRDKDGHGDSLQGEGGGGAEEIKEGKLALGLQN